AAARGVERFLADPARRTGFGSPLELAAGIVAVSNATMERALRVISVKRGYDPRDFALICYGNAGGLHAADLARSLRLRAVVVPENPGAFSALGILLSDVVRDVSRSVLLRMPAGGDARPLLREIERGFVSLERNAIAKLRREGFEAGRARRSRRLAVCYYGQ